MPTDGRHLPSGVDRPTDAYATAGRNGTVVLDGRSTLRRAGIPYFRIQRVRFKTSSGYLERGLLKPATVHQELRVLRRMLNVAVRKKLLTLNPCSTAEFPVFVKKLFRPHYVPWSEQQRIDPTVRSICGTWFASLRKQVCESTRNYFQ